MKKEVYATPEFFAVKLAAIGGILIHLFALCNVLVNHDNAGFFVNGYGAGADLGRWFLQLMGDILGKLQLDYNLPAVNGMIYLLLIGLSAGLFVSVFQIRNKTSAGLIGLLFAAFPTVCATMFYRFTVVYYGISLFLSVAAVWVLFRWRFGFWVSIVCITLSMGIYQAYVSMTIGMAVLLLLKQLLTGELDLLGLIRRGLASCAAIFAGAIGYYGCSQLYLSLNQIELSGYQGISEMGRISLRSLPGLIISAYRNVVLLPLEDYCGVGTIPLMRICYGLLFVVILGMLGKILLQKKDWLTAAAALLLLSVFPLAINFIVIMSPAWVHTLMIYSFVLIPCIPLILWELMPRDKILAKAGALIAACLIFLYGYYANANYMALYMSTEQAALYMSTMIAQVRMTEGYDADKIWAVIGTIQDPHFTSSWHSARNYEGNPVPIYTVNYRWGDLLYNYLGYSPTMMDYREVGTLAQLPEVQKMPCWPAAGSIRVVEEYVIIKCAE